MAVAAITEICCPMKDQSAGQVRRRQPPHPDVRVEIRTLVDHLGQHLIGRAQPGEPDTDLLREPSSRSPALLKLDKANRPRRDAWT